MASFEPQGRKHSASALKQDSKLGPSNEQRIAHVEVLLRRLYAKVDELENICKEEKDFYDILKRRGKKGIPSLDSQLLPKVIAQQQRCAEAAFNNLDIFKRNSRPASTRKVVIDAPIKEREKIRDSETRSLSVTDGSWRDRASSMRDKSSIRGSSSTLANPDERTNQKENSWYGSLDRNVKKKKRVYFDRNRRHTKTVGSLAGLNVENIEMLQPDEQYAYGLPTMNPAPDPKFLFNTKSNVSCNPARFEGNSKSAPQLPHQEVSLQWQLPRHHSYSRSQPVPMFPNKVQAPELGPLRWFDNSIDTFGSTDTSVNTIHNFDGASATDVNFNRLNISSPTEASERSSRSSENGDSKASFLNESCKPFEMADYYKYSTKYRQQQKGLPAVPVNSEATAVQRMNGLIHMRPEKSSFPGRGHVQLSEISDSLDMDAAAVPKLPPKLRPILNDSTSIQMPIPNDLEGNKDLSGRGTREREAWIHVNPTIV